MKFLKTAFHVHSNHSKDSSFSVQNIISLCLRYQVEVLIISDHNTLSGYFEAKKILEEKKIPIILISCEEIATVDGEVMGLFINQEIQKGLSLAETVSLIKQQRGIICIPHPFDSVRKERIRDKEKIEQIRSQIDLVEVFNSRNCKRKDNQKALKYALDNDKTMIWGSDAHFPFELKNCFFELPVFDLNPSSFLEAMKKARPLVQKKGLRGFFKSIVKKYLLNRIGIRFY